MTSSMQRQDIARAISSGVQAPLCYPPIDTHYNYYSWSKLDTDNKLDSLRVLPDAISLLKIK